ncbi:uncharacterized protein LOC130274561 [Hyla sarda]|uniref:uncharacterized protein LOC130274561 n=1 Tax=Hyla sarda TaxID=327740 RepID=UPI0024C3E7FF|nr:uncharacterized protein LOC130274561 [Hyla sarda]
MTFIVFINKHIFFLGDGIKNHWHSIRAWHMRDLKEEKQRPSGSGASDKTPYVHRPLLGFLQKCHEMRKTQSSVNMAPLPPPGPPSPTSQPLPGPSPDTADQGQEASPLPASSASRPSRQRIEVSFGDLVRPLGTGRKQQVILDNLIKLTSESFMKLDDRVEALREEFCQSRQAGAGPSTGPPSDILLHLQSPAHLVEKMPFDKQCQFRKESTDLVLRLCSFLFPGNAQSQPTR